MLKYVVCLEWQRDCHSAEGIGGLVMCTSKYLPDLWNRMKDDLTIRFMTDQVFQLSAIDLRAVAEARKLIDAVYKYKVSQLACVAVRSSGNLDPGTHFYCRRNHEFSKCAESAPIDNTHRFQCLGEPDDIVTLVTFHGNHDKLGNRNGEPYLIAPCERCIRQLEQLSPNALIVTDLDGRGRLAKIPLEACHYFRHPLRHSGE